jgi:large subunit ribosomal protein L24
MATIKKGDTVMLIGGAKEARGGDRGKTGTVLAVDKKTNRVIVEGMNLVTKHVRVTENSKGVKDGGLVTEPAPIHISKVALVDPETKKPTRLGVKVEMVKVEGKAKSKPKRVRIARKSGKEI